MVIYIVGHAVGTVYEVLEKQIPLIVYTNTGYLLPKKIERYDNKLHIRVDDIDKEKPTFEAPQMEHIEQFLDFSNGKKELISCCHAGVSRSSATAYVIASREYGPEKALGLLDPDWHWPNARIVKLGAEKLKIPEIWEKFVDWSKWHHRYNPSDKL